MAITKRRLSALTEQDIITSLLRHRSSDDIAAPNVHMPWECDFLSITVAGYAHEFEIKTSRADFKNDFKKPKHKLYAAGADCQTKVPYYGRMIDEEIPSQFWYVTTQGIVTAEDIPDYAGWIELSQHGHVCTRKVAPRLHKTKVTDATKVKVLKSTMKRYWLVRNRNKALKQSNTKLREMHANGTH